MSESPGHGPSSAVPPSRHHPRKRYGSPRVWEDLREPDMRVGRERVVRLLQEEGLVARTRKRFKSTEDYQAALGAQGITCSMSRRGNCYDNAVMESFFSTVKNQLGDRFDRCGEAKMELFDNIEVFYNQQRRHSTIGQVSPAAFEKAQATQAA